jgi:hypothetical protein
MYKILYPPAPVVFTDWVQLKGLESGEFVLQPKWDGRRAILMPDGTFRSKRNKAIDSHPWCDLPLPKVDVPLDLELMRDRAEVLDVMVDKSFDERKEIAKSLGLKLWDLAVNSVDLVNKCFGVWVGTGECDGVILKRRSRHYPINYNRIMSGNGLIKVKRLIHEIKN